MFKIAGCLSISMETSTVKLGVEKEYEEGYRMEEGHVNTASI